MKHLERHPVEVEGCFGCRVLNVSFGSVPGGTTFAASRKDQTRKFSRDMDAYYRARKAGERPNASTVEAVERNRREMEARDKKGLL